MKHKFQKKSILVRKQPECKLLQQARHQLILSQLLIKQYIRLLIKLQYMLLLKKIILSKIHNSSLQ